MKTIKYLLLPKGLCTKVVARRGGGGVLDLQPFATRGEGGFWVCNDHILSTYMKMPPKLQEFLPVLARIMPNERSFFVRSISTFRQLFYS